MIPVRRHYSSPSTHFLPPPAGSCPRSIHCHCTVAQSLLRRYGPEAWLLVAVDLRQKLLRVGIHDLLPGCLAAAGGPVENRRHRLRGEIGHGVERAGDAIGDDVGIFRSLRVRTRSFRREVGEVVVAVARAAEEAVDLVLTL